MLFFFTEKPNVTSFLRVIFKKLARRLVRDISPCLFDHLLIELADIDIVSTKYCDAIFASGAETEEFFYRLGIKDGLRLKSTVKSVLEMMSCN